MHRAETGSSRRVPGWLLGVAGVLLAARVASGLHESSHPTRLSSLVHWVPLEQAEALSKERRLPIFYEFSAEWCAPCTELSTQVFNDDNTARDINATYIPVQVMDTRQEEGANPPEVARLVNKYRVDVFPTLLIVSPEGKVVKSRFGYGGYTATLTFLGFPTPSSM